MWEKEQYSGWAQWQQKISLRGPSMQERLQSKLRSANGLDLPFEVKAIRLRRAQGSREIISSAELCQKVRGMDGLGQDLKFMALRPCFFKQIGRGCLPRKQENFTLWQPFASNDCGFDSGHASHDDVADKHVRLKIFERFDRFLAAEYRTRLKTCLIEDDRERVGNHLFVIGN